MERKYFPVVFFRTQSGNESVREWLKSLTVQERKVIGEDIKTVQFGWPLGMPLIKKLEPGLWEVRSRLMDKVSRVIFTFMEGHIVLLHGFIKKTQRIPQEDLHIARQRLNDLKGGAYEK